MYINHLCPFLLLPLLQVGNTGTPSGRKRSKIKWCHSTRRDQRYFIDEKEEKKGGGELKTYLLLKLDLGTLFQSKSTLCVLYLFI